jgi:hypothetical protein
MSGIARKHGVMPKKIGVPSIFPPPKKNHFLPKNTKFFKKERVEASQISNFKEMFLIMQNYLGGDLNDPPHSTPQIQGLLGEALTALQLMVHICTTFCGGLCKKIVSLQIFVRSKI